MNKYAIAIFSTLMMSGCSTDLFYKVAFEKDKTLHLKATEPFHFTNKATQENSNYKELLGNYRVVNSWDNSTYHFDRVSVFEKDGYIFTDLYSKGWTKPTHSIQFQGCQFNDEYKEWEFLVSLSATTLSCSHNGNAPPSARINYSFMIHKTTQETYARTPKVNGFNLGKKTPITTPYVAWMQVFGGDTRPTLALEKVENF